MSLIGMAVYSTEENKKDANLETTLESLRNTVDFDKHKLMVSVNAFTPITKSLFINYSDIIDSVFYNGSNIGTAKAINKVWATRKPGEHCIKMDDDITIHSSGWIEEMESAIAIDKEIGQIGLKRQDVWEHPEHENADLRSELVMLKHEPGHPWIVVEKVKHVIGSCVMHSSALLDKVGGLFQYGPYGYDDVLMSHRTHLAGYYCCFIPHILIDHTDFGTTPYQGWKEKNAGKYTDAVIKLVHAMYKGEESIKYPM